MKWSLLIVFNGLALWGLLRIIDQKSWVAFAFVLVVTVIVDVVYASRRFIPAKYLVPGTIFLALFGVFPVIYTVYISTTNYGTGHILTKDQAIAQIEQNSLIPPTDTSPRYRADVGVAADDSLFLLLTDAQGNYFLGTADGVVDADPSKVVKQGNRITSYDGMKILNLGEKNDRSEEIEQLTVPTADGAIRMNGLTEAREVSQRYVYDADRGVMVDTVDDTIYVPVNGTFVNPTAPDKILNPGWQVGIGLTNYKRLFTNETLRDPFFAVFAWTLVFSTLTVAMSFALGLLLAIIFNDDRMKGRRTYRSLVIIPYALPAFMTILVWRGMLNPTFGIINQILPWDINWFGSPFWARSAVLLVNLWLGFSYMFLVCTGALQGIPSDLREAAFVDGATGFAAFRKITFPLIMVAVAPVLIASFAFNFNNFNLIRLLTNGGPPRVGSLAGSTDILISYTNKVAFGGAGSDYGLATAISTIIFIIVALISAVGFRLTKAMEDIR